MLRLLKHSHAFKDIACTPTRALSCTTSVHSEFGLLGARREEGTRFEDDNLNVKSRARDKAGGLRVAVDESEPGPSTSMSQPVPLNSVGRVSWDKLSNVQSKDMTVPLLQVDYLPDDVTEEEVGQLFSEYGRVSGVMLRQSSRVDRFFGRAFVSMASEKDARRAFVAAGKLGLVLHDEGLAVELVHRPPDATTCLFVRNLSGAEDAVKHSMEIMFSQFGPIKFVRYALGNNFCHIVFETPAAVEKAVTSHIQERLRYKGRELALDYAFDNPSRVLHITSFVGNTKDVCLMFREYVDYADWIHVSGPKASTDGFCVAWVQFDNVDHADSVRDVLLARGLSASFSKQTEYPKEWTRNVPPSHRVLLDYAKSERRVDDPEKRLEKLERVVSKPVLHTYVLHLRGIARHATKDDVEGLLHSGGVTTPFAVHLVHSSDDEFLGRALISFDNKEDPAYIKQAHEKQPMKIKDKRIDINTALLPQLNDPRPVLRVDRVPEQTKEAQKEVLDKFSEFGPILRVWKGIDSNYYVEFSTTAEAILCLESHALRPFQVLGRKVRVNFAPPLDGPMHGQVFKRIIWDENAGEQFTYAPDPVE